MATRSLCIPPSPRISSIFASRDWRAAGCDGRRSPRAAAANDGAGRRLLHAAVAAGCLGPCSSVIGQSARRHQALRRRHCLQRRSAGRPRVTRHAVKERANESAMEALQEVQLGSQTCTLTSFRLPEVVELIAGWLREWQEHPGSTPAAGDVGFWRQRTILAMTRRLDVAAGRDYSGGRGLDPWEEAKAKRAPPLRVYGLHTQFAAVNGASEAPVALAFTSERRFPVGGVSTMHLDHLATNPAVTDMQGAGAALVNALIARGSEMGQVVTVEPQSDKLEEYFARLGFQQAASIDTYLWFFVGSREVPQPEMLLELRFSLYDSDEQDRIFKAFKRPPLRVMSSEEMYITGRHDGAAEDVLAVRVKTGQDVAGARRATITHFSRESAGESYVKHQSATAETVDAMGVMRNPGLLADLDWPTAEFLAKREPPSSGGAAAGSYMVIGRCSIVQRVYPLPGMASVGAEMVIEALELPMLREPICSVAIPSPLGMLAEATEAAKSFLANFGIRAAYHPSGEAWNLEVVSSGGLIASMLEPPSPDEKDADPLDFD